MSESSSREFDREAYIKAAVDAAPPLTPEQIAKLNRVFVGGTDA